MIGIIVNPRARGARDPRLPEALQKVLSASGFGPRDETPGQVVVTESPEALREAVRAFHLGGIGLIGACGGDGTTMMTITEMVRAYGQGALPRLLILRGGTVNTVATNLNVRGRPAELLRRALERCRGDKGAAALPLWGQDLIRVTSSLGAAGDGDKETRYGFLCAAAMGARFLQAYYRPPLGPGRLFRGSSGYGGPLWASLLALRTAASCAVPGGGRLARWLFAETETELCVDGEELPQRRFRLLLASTVPDVGLGMRVTWQAGRSPGRFHVVASALPLSSMARQLGRVLAGRALRGGPHVDRLARTARMRFPTPQPFTLDGELFEATEIEVERGPRIWIVATA